MMALVSTILADTYLKPTGTFVAGLAEVLGNAVQQMGQMRWWFRTAAPRQPRYRIRW